MLFSQGQGSGGRVLQAGTLEKMWTPQFAKPGENSGFGIGFYISQLDGHRVVEHGGAIYGFATQAAGLPDDKLGAVAVTTMDSSNAVTSHVTEVALRLMLAAKESRPLQEIPEISAIPVDRARQLEGRYGADDSAVNLIAANGELYLRRVAGGEQVRLRQSRDSLIADGRLGFGLQVTPVANGIRIQDHLLERVSTSELEPMLPKWKGLVGEYGWDYDKLYIFEENGRLSALIEWFDYAPLIEVSADVFDFPHSGLYDGEQAIFTRGASGQATQVKVSGVVFKRRPLSSIQGKIFHVTPLQPVGILIKEALAAQPPHESGDFLKQDLVDLSTLDPAIHFDIRYATKNNFLDTPVYSQPKAYMQRPAAEALLRASRKLNAFGYGLLIHDSYRPWYVTKIFWDATPEDKRIFVANPAEGSRHNRGCAVDLTLYDSKTGTPIEMTGVYDEMSERSCPFYPGGTSLQRWHRDLLRHAMEAEGFDVYEFEWWHFDYKDWRRYPILNLTFEELSSARSANRKSASNQRAAFVPKLLTDAKERVI